ncbi:putative RTA1 domain protein [Bimuria novae-zelandiae CBS 107.79]|uniref:Putative RTA1 domain protein n=1 Tax=Bimuria novae-zelandiae CBS 107.79 TaxID=1447943 RepID=A0A6A5V8H3_9PLEO|nr:putative RTA1 domain protein [Bimuria novae-zelandiae CBS 107.79]
MNNLHSRGGEVEFDLYPYAPSPTAGYAFLALFGIGGLVHLCMLIPLRAWFFILFVLGCVGEAAGYYGRAWSHSNIRNGSPYLIQLMLILASAPLLAATIYMTLGRLVRALEAEEHAFLSPCWTTKIYVLIDIGSFITQTSGAAMQASGDPEGIKTGKTIVIGGLCVQLGAFAVFIVSVGIFHRRLVLVPMEVSRMHDTWRRYMWMLYAVSGLIIVRSIFRLAEFTEGANGHLYKTETFLYLFDASIIFLVVVIMAILHPGILLRALYFAAAARSN